MPIEIRELIISARVVEKDGKRGQSSRARQKKVREKVRMSLFSADQVLKVLKRKKER